MKSKIASPARAHRHRAGLQWGPLTLFVAVIAALGWLGFRPGGWFLGVPEAVVRGAPVRRGPLRISVLEKGNLKAANAINLKSEVEGQTAILWLIPEGTYVEEGELLCELDVTQLIDRRFQQEISVRNAEAAFVKSQQNYEIQQSQNQSDIAQAEQQLTFAGQDLQKFLDTKQFDIDQANEAITEAEEANLQARNKLTWSEKLAGNGFLTATELEADTIAANRTDIRLTQARRSLKLLEDYDLPRQADELKAALEEAQRELDRVNLQASARIVDFEADMRTNEAKLKLEEENLQKLETQIEKAKIRAPRPGMVVYAQQEGGMRGNREPIAEGTQVRERQSIITIPSAEGMIAEASLHESVLKQVRVDQDCTIKVDSIPDREFAGKVSFVALMPDQQSWWANPNLRVYRTEIQILDAVEGMRPGMSCAVEILVDEIPDTLYVPVQSVFRHRGSNVCFVTGPGDYETREVEIGRFNDKWVQVLTGLQEGEEVLLSSPPGFTLEYEEAEADEAPEAGEELPGGPSGGMPGMGAASASGAAGAPRGAAGGSGEEAGAEGTGGRRGRGEMTPEMIERMRSGEGMTPEMIERMRSRGGGGRRSGAGQRGDDGASPDPSGGERRGREGGSSGGGRPGGRSGGGADGASGG